MPTSPKDPSIEARQPPCRLTLMAQLLHVIPKGRHLFAQRFFSRVPDKGPYIARFDRGQCALIVHLNDVVGRYLFVDGCWEPVVTSVFLHLLKPGQTFIDIGAHVGYFTLLAARRIMPGGLMIAFEPDPSNRKQLGDNLALNRVTEVEIEPLAVSASDGTVVFETSGQWNSGAANVVEHPQPGTSAHVESLRAVSLDNYCREKGIRQVDLVKMDIEGGEAQALAGMKQGLSAGLYRRILMEFHPGCLRSKQHEPRDILSQLLDGGFTAWQLSHRARGFTIRREAPAFSRSMLQPFDGHIPETPSHLLFVAKGDTAPL